MKQRLVKIVILAAVLIAIVKYPAYSPVLKSGFEKLKAQFDTTNKYRVQVPQIKGKTPDGRFIKHQFSGLDGRFVVVIQNNLKVYTQPNGQSSVSMLKAGERVRVIYRQPKSAGGDTDWVFITNERGRVNLGWVNASGLGFTNRFKPISNWTVQKLRFCKGGYCANFQIQGDGIYANKWGAQGGGIILQSTHYGRLYGAGKVIWAKNNEFQGWYDLFILADDGTINHEPKFKREPISQL